MTLMGYLDYDCHGGGCCGIRHLNDFPACDEEFWDGERDRLPKFKDKIEAIKAGIDNCIEDQGAQYRNGRIGPRQVAIEVVLNEYQWKCWERALQRCGFRRVLEFLNSNSGNRCRIYYLATNQPVKEKKDEQSVT